MSGADGIQTVEADNHYGAFGQAHNIAANIELSRLYVIGSTRGSDAGVCAGGENLVPQSTTGRNGIHS